MRNLRVGLVIAGELSRSTRAAFAGSRTMIGQLGRVTDDLIRKQTALGNSLSTALAKGGPGVAALRSQYDQLGRTIDSVRLKEEQLAGRLARRERLRTERSELRGQMFESAATGAAIGAPIVASVARSVQFEDQLRDTSITGEFSKKQEASLGQTIRESALRWNAFTDEIGTGISTLVAGGIQDARELERYTPILAKASVATRASVEDLSAVFLAGRNNLNIAADDSESALNMLAYAGKRGQFEIRDMAKWLPSLAPMFQALGVQGKGAVAEIGSALQVARMGAGSNDEAANNFRNFLTKITSPDTLKDFGKAGIDLQSQLMELRAKGLSPVQGMLQVITNYMGSKGPAAMAEFKAAMKLQDDAARDAALGQLSAAYGLGELFQDQQAMAFVRPAIANQDLMKDISAGAMAAGNQDLLGADWSKRMDTAKSQMDAFKIGAGELGLSLGNALLPSLNELLKAVIPMVHQFAEWTAANPGLVTGVVKLVAGAFTLRMGFLALAYGANLGASGLNGVGLVMSLVTGKFTLFRAVLAAGKLAPFITGLGHMRGALVGLLGIGGRVLRFGGLFLRGFGMAFGAPLMLAGRGVLLLGKVLGGSLLNGLRLAGQAVLWLGRALMLNPIGLLITGIALAAYLIYRYWEPIKGFFGGLWAEIKAGFNGGLTGILGLLVNFSPLGLFYRAFAGVMSYFGIELPGKFSEFGGMLVTGLVNGIKSMAGAAKDAVVGLGSGVAGWFKSTLGIKSPSRVFMAAGANISEGAALGIQAQQGLVKRAALGMAAATAVTLGTPQFAAAEGPAAIASRVANLARTAEPAALSGGACGGITVHFSPTIHVQGGGPGTQEAVSQALTLSQQELEQMLRRILADQQRRAF